MEPVPETVIVIKKEFIAEEDLLDEELEPDFDIDQDHEEELELEHHELKQELDVDDDEQIAQRARLQQEWFEFELEKQNSERLVLEQKEKKWSEREKQRKENEKVRALRILEEKEKKWSERERFRQEKAKKNEEMRSVFLGRVHTNTQRAGKFKKVQGKRTLVLNQINQFHEKNFLTKIFAKSIFCNFKNGQKSIFELGESLKMNISMKLIYLRSRVFWSGLF